MKRNRNNKQTVIAFVATVCVVVALFGGCRQRPVQQSGSSATYESKVEAATPAKVWRTNQAPNKTQAIHGYKRIQPGAGATTLPTQLATTQPGKLTAYLGLPSKGIIGVYGGNQTDNPADNIFSVKLDYQPTANDKVWLTYRLAGVAENSGVACSINDRLAFGGYLVKKDTATRRQRVQLNAQWLQKGENRIQFGLPEKADYGYRVSDLALEVEQGSNDAPVAVTTSHRLYNGKTWIHGFVSDDKARVTVDGKNITVRNGEFETVIVPTNIKQSELKTSTKGGVSTKTLHWGEEVVADREYALHAIPARTEKAFEKGKLTVLKTPDVTLQAENTGLSATKLLSVTPLRPIDLPALDLGMTNVTADKEGFRFLPHGEHFAQKAATVSLKYDRTKIPDGYTENDIRTFYFDPNSKHWVALDRDTVDKTVCMVVSKTTHFTDMINGVIKTPESPQTEGFAPTMMNDIKAADPTSKIEMIAPPATNNQGSANLSYPIELPPARNGMNPNLAITYNSDGGSGWLGEGWDLNIPSITVDTKFGVPIYDKDSFETETYSLNGTQLARAFITNGGKEDNLDENMFFPDRGVVYLRNKETIVDGKINPNDQYLFYPKVETNFPYVTRVGTNIGKYRWQLHDKNGVKYYYGYEYAPGEQAVLAGDSVIYKQVNGTNYYKTPIGEWKLQSMVDIHGDSVAYIYSKTLEDGYGSIKPKAIYLSSIQLFNRKANGETPYIQTGQIEFISKSNKTKKTNNARYGFLVSSQRLLDSIIVKYCNANNKLEKVRAYSFQYATGRFMSNLLSSISQHDSTNTVVSTHQLNYYDKVAEASGNYFNSAQSTIKNQVIPTGVFGISPALLAYKQLTQKGIINNNKSTGLGGSLYLGFGPGAKVWTIENSIGVVASTQKVTTLGESTLIDIDGDGELETVYQKNDKLHFVKHSLGNKIYDLEGAPANFSKTTNKSITLGVSANFSISARADWDLLNRTEVSSYFMDVNGDGLVDIVSDGKVYFNYLDDKIPHFSLDSKISSIPMTNKTIYNTTPAAAGLVSFDKTEENKTESEASPLQDLIRVWQAPFAGEVRISGNIKLIPPTGKYDTLAYQNADGVRVAIQTNKQELWARKIGKTENQEISTDLVTTVSEGQRIYFRVQSGDSLLSNGDFDIVKWSPVIKYTPTAYLPESYDESGYSNLTYKASEGNIINKIGYNVIDTGVPVKICGNFKKPITTNNVILQVFSSNYSQKYKEDTLDINNGPICNPNYHYNTVATIEYDANNKVNDPININLTDNKDKYFWFVLSSLEDVRWDSIKCQPNIQYSYIDKNGKTIIDTVYAGVRYNTYHYSYDEISNPYSSTWVNEINSLEIFPVLINRSNPESYKMADNCNPIKGTYTITERNESLGHYVTHGPYDLNSTKSDVFYLGRPLQGVQFDVYLDEDTYSNSYYYGFKIINRKDGNISSTQIIKAAALIKTPDNYTEDYGSMWRGWGQFEYNAARGRYSRPIDEDSLQLLRNSEDLMFNDMHLVTMAPEFNYKRYWQGYSNNISLRGDTMITGRLVNNNLVDINVFTNPRGPYRVKANFNDTKYQIVAPVISSKQTNFAVSAGGNLSELLGKLPNKVKGKLNIGIGAGASFGKSEKTLDYLDLNGDGFPDYFKEGVILYSNSRGTMADLTNKRSKSLLNQPVSINSTASFNVSINPPSGCSPLKTSTDNPVLKGVELSQTIGASASLEISKSTLNISYQDINADGLPDMINHDNKTVCLNYGYSFSSPFSLSIYDTDVVTASVNKGLGIGKSLFGGCVSLGIGIGAATSSSNNRLLDINGDGLQDLVFRDTEWNPTSSDLFNGAAIPRNVLKVRFNNGTGFIPVESAEKLSDNAALDFTESISESANASGGWGWSFLAAKFVFNVRVQASNSNTKLMDDIKDYNGDGFPDILYTQDNITDNQLLVKNSTIAYTNKLKSITNPLGGIITLDYKRSECSTDHPGGKWVLKLVSVSDGVTDDGPYIRTDFDYKNGKYNRREREFDGFGEVTTYTMKTDAANFDSWINTVLTSVGYSSSTYHRKQIQTFDNRNCYVKGNILSSTVYDNLGNKYQETKNQYYSYNVKTHRVQDQLGNNQDHYCYSGLGTTDFNDSIVVYSPIKYSITKAYNPETKDSVVTNRSYYEYWAQYEHNKNHFGDIKTFIVCNRTSGNNLLDENGMGDYDYKTNIDYNDYLKFKYNASGLRTNIDYFVAGLPNKVTVANSTNKLLRQVKAYYTHAGYPTHLTRISQTLNDRGDSAVTTLKYDKAGNITNKVLPSKMAYNYTYDTRYNMYVTQVKDTFGYVSKLEDYNYKYGVPCKRTDENGNVMTSKLDNLGRVISITGPNEQSIGKATIQFYYYPNAKSSGSKPMPYAITKHYDPANTVDPNNAIETVTFVDGIGRAIQVKKDGFVDGQEVSLVSGRVKYDAFGRTKLTYYPTVEALSQKYAFNAAFDSTSSHIASTRTTYDVLDRVVSTTLPDKTTSTMAYAIADGYLKTTATDALGNKQETFTDGSGKTVKTVQYNKDSVLTTRFHYDAIEQLDTVIDTRGKKTISVYDIAGRRTQVTHPASGTTNFGYDAAGNQIWMQTANLIPTGKKIQYFYTYNRMDSISYPNHPENNVKMVYGTASEADSTHGYRAGRLKYQEDGSGRQEFWYGKQGELKQVRRTLVIPNQAVATYTTKTAYDSWNRLISMTYPDNEQVNYTYNLGGLLTGVASSANTYVSDIRYDKFEQRTYMKYGNGAETYYAYNDSNHTLTGLSVKSTLLSGTPTLMSNAYKYDRVKNVVSVINSGTAVAAANTLSGSIGGTMEHTYKYDNLYRLVEAHGDYNKGNATKSAHYDLQMGYDNMYNITRKVQHITQTGVQFNGTLQAGYNLGYTIVDNSQQIANIADTTYRTEGTGAAVPEYKASQFNYDANGNLLSIQTGTRNGNKLLATNSRKMLWDEENRMLATNDNGFVTNYFYDAAGERTVKMSGDGEGVNINGLASSGRTGTTNFTAYISPYLVVRNGGEYTKHIYMGGQRITSKVSNSGVFASSPVTTTDLQAKYAAQTAKIKERFDSLGVTYKGTPQSGGLISSSPSGVGGSYFYHSDHLGSSSLITDQSGTIVQHLEYVPFGETFIDERKSQSSWTTPYLFSGKERDEETGLLYFGARYQDSRYGIWYSVDPLAEKYPGVSGYVYCESDPVNLVDPDGRSTNVTQNKNGTFKVVDGNLNDKDLGIYVGTLDKNGKFTRSSNNPIGYTMSMTSFYNDDNKKFMGNINPNDQSGLNFLKEMTTNTPQMGDYMAHASNATASNSQTYDFKATNGTDKAISNDPNYYYRGMPVGTSENGLTVYSSGREIGNFVAGFVAGANGMSWGNSRLAFDALQSSKSGKLTQEGFPSQAGEYAGWKRGNSLSLSTKMSNLIKSTPSTMRYIFNKGKQKLSR